VYKLHIIRCSTILPLRSKWLIAAALQNRILSRPPNDDGPCSRHCQSISLPAASTRHGIFSETCPRLYAEVLRWSQPTLISILSLPVPRGSPTIIRIVARLVLNDKSRMNHLLDELSSFHKQNRFRWFWIRQPVVVFSHSAVEQLMNRLNVLIIPCFRPL